MPHFFQYHYDLFLLFRFTSDLKPSQSHQKKSGFEGPSSIAAGLRVLACAFQVPKDEPQHLGLSGKNKHGVPQVLIQVFGYDQWQKQWSEVLRF